MLATVAILALLASIIIYIGVSLGDARRLTSTEGFFHDAGAPWRAVISLTAFSITLGTGVVYVLSQARTTGWYIFLTPFGVFAGYVAIAYFYKSLAFKAGSHAPNIYYLLSKRQQDGTFKLSAFARFFGIFMAVTYLLVLAYELDVGSGVIIEALLIRPTPAAQIGLAMIIFGVVAVYTGLAGLRAAVSTDVAQIIFIVAFVGALAWLLSISTEESVAATQEASAANATLAVSSALLALIMAVTTQFYSIVNANMGAGYDPDKQKTIFIWVGALSGLFYVGVAFMGLFLGSPAAFSQLVSGYVYQPDPGFIVPFIVAMLFSGMLAVLMSTLDNMTVSVTQIFSENLFKLKTFDAEGKDPKVLWRLRVSHGVVSSLVILIMLVFNHAFDQPFALLLTILFAATIMSPLAAAAAWISAHGGSSWMHRPLVAWPVFVATVLCWIWYFQLTWSGERQASVWLHLVAFLAALLISIADLIQNRRTQSASVAATAAPAG